MTYEHRHQRLLSRAEFAMRMVRHVFAALVIVFASLIGGILGFHFISGLSVIDSILNSAMLLGGMGPVGNLGGDWGKLFASFYALYAGLVFIAVAGLLSAPVFHRLIHRFHLQATDSSSDSSS